MDIKQQLFEKVDALRKPVHLFADTRYSIQMMSAGRRRLQAHFCETHFFNPPRYLKLLELIPGPKTSPGLKFLLDYLKRFLGKTTVQAKHSGVHREPRGGFSMMVNMHLMREMGLTPKSGHVTGPLIGSKISHLQNRGCGWDRYHCEGCSRREDLLSGR